MEMMLNGPLKAIGWVVVALGLLCVFGRLDAPLVPSLFTIVMGAGMVWAGRWLNAVRTARLERKWERHDERVGRLRGE